jgi:hypothetical protein
MGNTDPLLAKQLALYLLSSPLSLDTPTLQLLFTDLELLALELGSASAQASRPFQG